MKSRLFLIIAMLLFAGKLFGNEVSVQPAKELQLVENQLKIVLSKLGDEVSFKYSSNDTIEFRYHTRKFMIHTSYMTGKVSEKASERIGPDFDGFILWVQLQDAGFPIQANTPQTIREPYWNSYLAITQMTDTNKQIYWGLSYWSKTDQKVLSQIKETLWKFDKSPKNIPYKAQQIAENQGEELTGLFKKNLKSNSPYRIELIGGSSLNLRGKILENLKEDTRIWVTGQIYTKLYISPSPEAAMISHWDIWMEVENYKEISKSFEISDLD